MLTRSPRGSALLSSLSLRDVLDGRAPGLSAPVPTPAYVYDLDAIAAEARELGAALGDHPHLVAYAVKANTAGPIVRALVASGCGADVVSGGELEVALACGARPEDVVYSGVAKTARELDLAIGAGERGILAIQAESVEEIARVDARARAVGRRARVSLRLNPGVEADTHAHVATGHDEAKFGIAREDLPAAWDAIARAAHVELVGLTTHVGSQLTDLADYMAAAEVLLDVATAREAAAGPLAYLDFGGGFGIDYGAGCPVRPADFARALVARVARSPLARRTLLVEPGRSLVAAHGALCASVIMEKRSRAGGGRRWLLIDAGMNDLVRPALYGARHRIEPLDAAPAATGERYRVVGPVCESSDDFGDHLFGEPLPERVVIRDAGAYGFTMASQYNGRALPAEVFLGGGEVVAVSATGTTREWIDRRVAPGRSS
jgi:diaminopimelate decarboxylase